MHIETTVIVNAPAAAAWEVFGERFERVSDWADSVLESSLEGPLGNGAVRTCDIKPVGPIPAGQVTEEITQFDRSSHALTYAVRSGIPKPMKSIENAWTIEALADDKCRVTSRATFALKWWMQPMSPLMRFPLSRAVRDFTEQLAKHVEAQNAGQAPPPLAPVG
jgi:hypothetical protein